LLVPSRNWKKNLRNSPLHCFGIQTKCSANFCKTARQNELSLLNSTVILCDEPTNNTDGELLTGTYEKCKLNMANIICMHIV